MTDKPTKVTKVWRNFDKIGGGTLDYKTETKAKTAAYFLGGQRTHRRIAVPITITETEGH